MSKDNKTIDIARQVIDDEVEALIGLKNYIDENFEEIVDVIYKCKGRLIFTGIGKSGHISKKISATLSSTGTSSFFIHSTEAFHGDLGMIQSDDIVVAISYSGETEDLIKTIPIIKKLGCFVIGVSGNDKSTLSKISDYHQLIKVEKEACPLDLAPTSSATATLVWGDALAISLMNKKGFNEAQNHKIVYRPWGSFLSIEEGKTWQIKKIEVNPGASLSLQMHFHRSEHWVVVSGTAKILIENNEK